MFHNPSTTPRIPTSPTTPSPKSGGRDTPNHPRIDAYVYVALHDSVLDLVIILDEELFSAYTSISSLVADSTNFISCGSSLAPY